MSEKTVVALIGLFVFGIVYNALVDWLGRRGRDQGYVAFLVVAGTAITLLAASLTIGWSAALWVLAHFMASGLPMILGSMWRYMSQRERDQRQNDVLMRNLLEGMDDKTKVGSD